MTTKRGFILLAVASIALVSVHTTHAVNIATTLPGDTSNPSSDSPSAFIANFYTYALSLAGILAFGIIVYGGVRYMTSAGNPSARTDAKEWIEAALLGILLLAAAYLILNIVNPNLVHLGLPQLQTTATPATSDSGFDGFGGGSTGGGGAGGGW